jgi:hypothetical protein
MKATNFIKSTIVFIWVTKLERLRVAKLIFYAVNNAVAKIPSVDKGAEYRLAERIFIEFSSSVK